MEKNWVLTPGSSIFKGCREQISSSKLCTHWQFCTCTSGGYQSIQPESSLIPSGLEQTTFSSEEDESGSEVQKWTLTSPEAQIYLFFLTEKPVGCVYKVLAPPHFQMLSTSRTLRRKRRETKRYHKETLSSMKSGLASAMDWNKSESSRHGTNFHWGAFFLEGSW